MARPSCLYLRYLQEAKLSNENISRLKKHWEGCLPIIVIVLYWAFALTALAGVVAAFRAQRDIYEVGDESELMGLNAPFVLFAAMLVVAISFIDPHRKRRRYVRGVATFLGPTASAYLWMADAVSAHPLDFDLIKELGMLMAIPVLLFFALAALALLLDFLLDFLNRRFQKEISKDEMNP